MMNKADRQTSIYKLCDEKSKRSIEEFIKLVREEIREWRFLSLAALGVIAVRVVITGCTIIHIFTNDSIIVNDNT